MQSIPDVKSFPDAVSTPTSKCNAIESASAPASLVVSSRSRRNEISCARHNHADDNLPQGSCRGNCLAGCERTAGTDGVKLTVLLSQDRLDWLATCDAGFGVGEGTMQTIPIVATGLGFSPSHPFTVQRASSHRSANRPFSPVSFPSLQPLTPILVSSKVAAIATSGLQPKKISFAPTGQFPVSIVHRGDDKSARTVFPPSRESIPLPRPPTSR